MRFTRDVLIAPLLRPLISILACLVALPAAAQTFVQPKVIPTGNWPAAVYSADVNNDGYPDLIYIDQGATPGQPSTTHILLNDGQGNFTQASTLATVGTSLAIADMDGNGTPDIVYVTTAPPPPGTGGALIGSYTAYVAYGNGNGTFAASAAYATPIYLTPSNPPLSTFLVDHVVVGHFYQKTGPLDVVAEDTAHSALLKFAGGSTLSQADGIPGTGPIQVAALTSSGYQDLILQQSNTNILTLLGGPSFEYATAPVSFSGTSGVRSALLRDMNGDGRPDLIAEGANGHIDVFPGNGDGTFQTTSIGGSGSYDGTLGFGGHLIGAAPRLVDGALNFYTATPIGISTLVEGSNFGRNLAGIDNAGPGRTAFALADFNRDGAPDLAVDSPEGIAILFADNVGRLDANQSGVAANSSGAFPAGQPALSVALGHFTSSGYTDAVVSTGATQAQVLLGSSIAGNERLDYIGYPAAVPTPTTSANGTAGLWSTTLTGDFNGDGLLDIATAADGAQSTIPASPLGTQVQLGNGTGAFSAPTTLSTPASSTICLTARAALTLYGSLTVGDFNGDGISDLIVSDHLGTGVFEGGSGLAAPRYIQDFDAYCPTGTAHQVAVTAPITGSAPDLITQQNGALVLIPSVFNQSNNNGTGPFTDPSGNSFSVDGQLDTPGQKIAPIMSTTFGGTSPTLNFPAAISAMAVADLDRDGNNDLVVVYANLSANLTAPVSSAPNYIYIWYGSGGGKFLTSAKHPVNPVVLTPSRNFYQAVLTDMNGDGIPDLVLSDGYLLSVQLNDGAGNFGQETHFLAGQGINGIAAGDLRNIRHNDLVIANGGAVLSAAAANLEKLATNPDVNTGGVTVLLNAILTRLVPTGTVAATPEPSPYTTQFTLTATIGGVSGNPTPTGTVTFSVDGAVVGTATTLSSTGIATVTYAGPNTLAVGNHTVTAVYSGDGIYQPANFNATHAVSATPITPSGNVVASPEPSTYGNPWNLTATINTTPGIAAPTGTVTFYVDGVDISTTPVNLAANGTASIPEPSLTLAPGTHMISAVYSGDTNYATVTFTGTHVINAAAITTSVVASPEPSVYGQAFTITATAGPGTYDFSVDGVDIGTVPSTANTASISGPTTLNVGIHSLSVLWHATVSALAIQITGTHQVVINPTTLSLLLCVDNPGSLFPCGNPIATTPLISPITFYYGQSLDGVATESETDLTGSIIFYDGTRVFCTLNANLTGGANTCPPTSGDFDAGSRVVYATYTGDQNNAPSTSNSINVTVYPDPTTVSLTSSMNPALAGTAITFTAILSGNYATPNGFVNFYDGSTFLGSGALDPTGHANLTTSTLAPGTHPITVVYAGNNNFNAVTSAILNQVIDSGPVTGAVSATPEPSDIGAAFTLTATVTHPAGSTAIPTGTITFSVDGVSVGSATLSGGVASLAGPTTLTVGTHALTATYSGDTNYVAAGPFSGTHAVILAPTTTQLTATGSTTIYYNQPANYTYTTTVASSTHPPTGTVTLQDNGVNVGACTNIAYGTACPYGTASSPLAVGTHSLVLTYNGDSYNATSTSTPLVYTVLADTTTATVASSLNPSQVGNLVTFTATVTGNAATPTGSVNFLDGTTVLATQPLSLSGTATYITGVLTLGTHPITVVYAGTTNFSPVTSTILNQIVTLPPPTFTFSVTPNPVTAGAGSTTPILAIVTTSASFTASIQLSCSGLPYETTCNFVTPVIPAAGGATTLQLHVSAPHDCGSDAPYFIGSTGTPASPAPYAFAAIFFGAFAIFQRRRKAPGRNDPLGCHSAAKRRNLRLDLLLIFLALAAFTTLSGCAGHCTDLGTRPGTYSFTVTATPQGVTTPAPQSITIPLTVTIP